MRIAVLTLTRDRVDYTRHCFARLRELAGCDFDHFILDQASDDETADFLEEYEYADLILLDENVGIHRGHNLLLDAAGPEYDAYVTFDNDCELTADGTLEAVAAFAVRWEWIASPVVNGLHHPPRLGPELDLEGVRAASYPEIGGIFRAMPATFAHDFRFDESQPIWGRDERTVGAAARERGFGSGYLLDWSINHYETTAGQEARYPDYFARKYRELSSV